jgi:DNA modification methylase
VAEQESVGEADGAPGISRRNTLNDLTAKEWLSESVSVWTQRGLGAGHAEAQIERQHPAPFSFQDVGRLIALFTKAGMTVLDPFVGVGSTLKACALLGREGIGIELNPIFAELARQRLQVELLEELVPPVQTIYEGDVRVVAGKLQPDSVDLIVTSPPYWGILNKKPDHKVKSERVANDLSVNYGEDPRDLANIDDYEEFIVELANSLTDCSRALRERKHLALIVGDFRHGGRYYPFHADIAAALEERGFVLKAMNVLYQRHKRVFPYGYPAAYVSNVHHQNIVILRKETA